MKIEQFYTSCLAEAAYYIESDGEAAIIDPLRESTPYLRQAEADGAKIKFVLETHFHADFVSGHQNLARKTGACIVFGPTAQPGYAAYIAADEEVLSLGKIKIKVLHTPGHTLESTCYLLIDESGKEYALFTGDTLFIGDVGRPDLVQKVKAEITPEYLAGKLFDSLRSKIMPLPDSLLIYPGHGAGSACGKKMSKETISTLGLQKQFNYALRANMTRQEFITEVLTGLTEPPAYFPGNVLLNVCGSSSIDEVIKKGVIQLNVNEFETRWKTKKALVIDTRSTKTFPLGFIPGSIFIGIDDTFAPWVGTLVADLMQPLLFVCDAGREAEVVTRLARVGYDHVLGYLKGGMEAWKAAGNPIDTIEEITPAAFVTLFRDASDSILLDVRRASEFEREHIIGAYNIPLSELYKNLNNLSTRRTYYLYCAGGYRSLIAASIFKSGGIKQVINIKGGYNALKETGLPKTNYSEVNTEL